MPNFSGRPDVRGPGRFAAPVQPAWVPDDGIRERSRYLAAMAAWGFADLESLHAASVDDPEWFWRAVVTDLDIEFHDPFDKVLDASRGHALPLWFTGGRLNAAHLCCYRHAGGPLADKPAVVYEGDAGQQRQLTYRDLDAEVRKFAANLVALGVERGDRVVLFLPVVPEAVTAFLACASIGAISVPAFTGYGPEALATRLRVSGATALITADGTTRRGKPVNLKSVADEALDAAPSVRLTVVVAHRGDEVYMRAGRDVYWHNLDPDPVPVPPVAMNSNDPLTLIYTSGTTGAPKGIVHSHAGFAVKAAIDFAYGFDIHEDDVVAWIADMGWMLGPLLILGGLQLGATVVLIGGSAALSKCPEAVADRRTPWRDLPGHRAHSRSFADERRGRPAPRRVLGAFLRLDRRGVGRPDMAVAVLRGRRDGHGPIVNYSGGTETGGGILVGYPFLPDGRRLLQRPAARHGCRHSRSGRRVGRRRGGRTMRPEHMARNDARILAGQRALPRDVLEPLGPRLVAR